KMSKKDKYFVNLVFKANYAVPARGDIIQYLDCNKEYVEIFDGYPHVSTPLGRTCSGIYLNYTYISTSNTMTILLHRDSYYSGNGFYASYYSIPLSKSYLFI
uniref:CUB domain-containing protein n=1 Tax=Podarcis muralis TaxID=64176 RepID=A0A670ICF2_PODMU